MFPAASSSMKGTFCPRWVSGRQWGMRCRSCCSAAKWTDATSPCKRRSPAKPAASKLTPAHLVFLKSLRNGDVKPAAATNMVATLPARLSDLPVQARQELGAILERLMPTLQSLEVPSTVVHGDFAPWNLRTHDGRISAFDWEYGELDGLPLIDETHYLLQLGSQLHHWNVDQAYQCLAEIAASGPLGMNETQVRAIHSVYLIDSLVRLLNEGYDADDEMLAWYRQLLNRLSIRSLEAVAV